MDKTTRAVMHDMTDWTEFVVAGTRVYIRTRRPLAVASDPRGAALAKDSDRPVIEVRTVVPEAEP